MRRAFAGVNLADLDPFIHMDQMGEVDYAPYEPRGTDWHPHRGFETVTYIIDGTFVHQDSHGGGGTISNGATQWMTAGGGILHIETPPEELVIRGGLFHGVQLWVNLPAKDKMVAPAYQNLEGDLVTLAVVARRRRAGAAHRRRPRRAPRPGSTHTPIVVAHATIAPGARLDVPWDPSFNALAYVLSGEGTVGDERRPVQLRPARRVRRGRPPDHRPHGGRRAPRGAPPRRRADPRAGRAVRPVRDEHRRPRSPRRSTTSSGARSVRSRPTASARTEA